MFDVIYMCCPKKTIQNNGPVFSYRSITLRKQRIKCYYGSTCSVRIHKVIGEQSCLLRKTVTCPCYSISSRPNVSLEWHRKCQQIIRTSLKLDAFEIYGIVRLYWRLSMNPDKLIIFGNARGILRTSCQFLFLYWLVHVALNLSLRIYLTVIVTFVTINIQFLWYI